MKNSGLYARKVKKLLAGAAAPRDAEDPVDLTGLVVRGVFEDDVPAADAEKALAALNEEFVDFNELRVSPPKDIVECVGRSYPGARAKAESVIRALDRVFGRANVLSLDWLTAKPKREVRKALREDMGLGLYAEALVTLYGFAGHAIPVDDLLLEALKLDKRIHPDSDKADLQGFLERIILNKDARMAHEALRRFAAKAAPRIMKDRARRERQALAAKAKAEAEAARQAREAEKKRAKAEADKAAKKAKAAPAKRSRKAAPKKTKSSAAGARKPAKSRRSRK